MSFDYKVAYNKMNKEELLDRLENDTEVANLYLSKNEMDDYKRFSERIDYLENLIANYK